MWCGSLMIVNSSCNETSKWTSTCFLTSRPTTIKTTIVPSNSSASREGPPAAPPVPPAAQDAPDAEEAAADTDGGAADDYRVIREEMGIKKMDDNAEHRRSGRNRLIPRWLYEDNIFAVIERLCVADDVDATIPSLIVDTDAPAEAAVIATDPPSTSDVTALRIEGSQDLGVFEYVPRSQATSRPISCRWVYALKPRRASSPGHRQSTGYERPRYVVRRRKALYELKDAARAWNSPSTTNSCISASAVIPRSPVYLVQIAAVDSLRDKGFGRG